MFWATVMTFSGLVLGLGTGDLGSCGLGVGIHNLSTVDVCMICHVFHSLYFGFFVSSAGTLCVYDDLIMFWTNFTEFNSESV